MMFTLLPATTQTRLPITHHRDGLFVPFEVRPHVGATLATCCADEKWPNVGQPGIIRPVVATDRNRMFAVVVSAICQQAVHALSARVILVRRLTITT